MDLAPYVDNLRRELAVAADAGGEDARALAERLTAPLESAARLVLLNVLSAAADEITRDLAPGSVDVRLRGVDPTFVVTPPPVDQSADRGVAEDDAPPPSLPPVPTTDEGATARINFRLPEHLKARVEEAAGREGLSVNTWLVRAVAATLDADGHGRRSEPRGLAGSTQRFTGWVR
ncbi:HicB family protein [Streptoalloteichus tenebrarius]|uniref:HicB family protein n=1 Tax=Streptoalloteichus tenebrarius (strain ATCC 17920 / DSM 40477 / JCM 4838 / CBS 697.72 / NBRC 16177 / NCIMB 11028 / NRRL B-12390 / A12253. 1 / ISP 5477) TaxID=1933 RepID=A0ABT1HWH0_STRSD|nr:toxin-antitoxin system HicB family antitoxin [Streptoalloteichus tenebrarius]MCP2259854.1 HicB family protein [Streptoalloteichus tenebrarius]BFE99195.1 hypothetical protein GCM10020241_08710 [Streptoalloteichus tenebrarius]